ncbi:hypothetical protein QR680_006529 [Steinernema hermaphroditum]|uniref:Dendritic cell-specific transmembrane protein-like domain-containing protein n=1 Tax=Steinernema hermaphroditum TaxID=289476 RepID=A0AA39LWQ2_9BILA|nr:hypothetical protein QR680_006529 [Steinernema hermaphroditum]
MVLPEVYGTVRKAKKSLEAFRREKENARRFIHGEKPLEPFKDRMRPYMLKIFPFLHGDDQPPPTNFYEQIFYPGTLMNNGIRFFLVWLFCQLVGIIIFFLFMLKFPFRPILVGAASAIAVQTVTIIAFVVPASRIIVLLTLPKLLTGKLRTMILLLIVSWAFQVAAMNITTNIQQTAASITCVQQKMEAQKKEKVNEMKSDMYKKAGQKLNTVLVKVSSVIQGVRSKLRLFQTAARKIASFPKSMGKIMKDVTQKCGGVIRAPFYTCVSVFTDVHDKCMYNNLFFCDWVKPIENLVCNSVMKKIGNICDLPRAVQDQVKERVSDFQKIAQKEAMKQLENYTLFDIAVKSHNESKEWSGLSPEARFKHNLTETSSLNRTAIAAQIKEDLKYFDKICVAISYICDTMVFVSPILPFFKAIMYLKKFLSEEKLDNYFLSDEFMKIDKQREAQGETPLFPLTAAEKKKIIPVGTRKMVGGESARLTVSLGLLFVSAAVPLLLVLLDMGTYSSLYDSYDFFHSNNTRVDLPNMYLLKVHGNGFMSELFRMALKMTEPVGDEMRNRDETWKECFEEPSPPNYPLFKIMLLMFIGAFFLTFLKVYAYRVQHLIAEYYFPERKRPRALFLYNQILEERTNMLKVCVKEAKKNAKADAELVADEKQGRSNLVNDGLKSLGNEVHKCIRCERTDLKYTDGSNARVCANCSVLFCVDCFTITKHCPGCNFPVQIMSKAVEFYMDSSGDEDELTMQTKLSMTSGSESDVEQGTKKMPKVKSMLKSMLKKRHMLKP